MRAYLASSTGLATSVGLACATVLTLASAPPAVAAGSDLTPGRNAPPAGVSAGSLPGAEIPGSTQSLPLEPVGDARRTGGAAERGLRATAVRSFSLAGVVWDDPGAELRGQVQIRTRASRTRVWSAWQSLETRNDGHGPDPATREGRSTRMRGSTAPLWVGDSDGVEVRVRAEADQAGGTRAPLLPDGLRVELVDPGADPRLDAAREGQGASAGRDARAEADAQDVSASSWSGIAASAAASVSAAASASTWAWRGGAYGASAHEEDGYEGDGYEEGASDPDAYGRGTYGHGAYGGESSARLAASAANARLAPLNAAVIPALSAQATRKAALRQEHLVSRKGGPGAAGPFIGPRPRIVTRAGWGADESLRESGFVYTGAVKVAFVHHTASGNNYSCSQAPSVIRSIYRYHVVSSGWRDIGYNFLIDKCGTIYEGRAGGVDKPVMGAHTLGFNTNSTGIAVLGTFTGSAPSAASVNAIASLTAWKLGLSGMDPRAKTYLTSGGGNRFPKGEDAHLNVISGHRDGFATECPGAMLYGRLGAARTAAARLQGR
ncbi:peptidoglycan recognition protein [Streptomyces sp. NPDC048664]|uniref:peptidoglycan recognition protein family protein n=1 Tax=Streptomyces sp. NPDC048664 TaxID=3154505 RepID=UPI00341FDE3D